MEDDLKLESVQQDVQAKVPQLNEEKDKLRKEEFELSCT